VLKDGGRLAVVAYERKPWTRLNAKYLIRPLTRRMPKGLLLKVIQCAMPVAFLATEMLYRIPLAKRLFKFVIPIANYADEPRLSRRQRYEWAILDTFDMLSPAFDRPQTAPELIGALAQAGIVGMQRRPTGGLSVVGTKQGAVAQTA
jgi:hypothetical protein